MPTYTQALHSSCITFILPRKSAPFLDLLAAGVFGKYPFCTGAGVQKSRVRMGAAGQDTAAVLSSEQGDAYQPLLEAFASGEVEVGCDDFFSLDFDAIIGGSGEATQAADE